MKRKTIYTVLALLCAAFAIPAHGEAPGSRVEISSVDVKYTGGKIGVTMLLDAENAGLRRAEAVVLTPVIRSGAHRLELPPIVFSGRRRTKSDSRAGRFGTRTVPYDTGSAIAPATVLYDESVSFEPWMAGAEVVLEENVYGCASNNTAGGAARLASLQAAPVKPAGTPMVAYITPEAETVKNRRQSGSAFLDFPVGKSAILADFSNNAQELDKIRQMIRSLSNDAHIVIDSAALRGYASPEGSYALNERLSRNRAEALRKYLQREYPSIASMTTVSAAAEDWEGLKLLVLESNLPGRAAILNIINSSDSPDAKERQLRALDDYRELSGTYFPKLRKVEYHIDYTVGAFSVEEGKVMITTNPGHMCLNEMYLVANSYARGSDEFNMAFKTAVHVFPDDPAANINYAATLLERGRAADAHRYLDKYTSHANAWNNLGVMYMLEGDYAGARFYLEKASGPEAAHNLELLSRLERYAQEKEAFQSKLNTMH